MRQSAIPYRIGHAERALAERCADLAVEIAVQAMPRSPEAEARLHPQFALDTFYVAARRGTIEVSLSGVLEWGVFWYRLDAGAPKPPDQPALMWTTIDRLPSILAVAARLLAGNTIDKPDVPPPSGDSPLGPAASATRQEPSS